MTVYDLVHRTRYSYPQPVSESYSRAVLRPRSTNGQHVISHHLVVDPAPSNTGELTDQAGNHVSFFTVTTAHQQLEVTARSRVEVTRTIPDLTTFSTVTWEELATDLNRGRIDGDVIALQDLRLPSTYVTFDAAVQDFAQRTFSRRRPVVEAVMELVGRVFTELVYAPGSTTVHTTHAQVLGQRSGVCQDFAHLVLSALRMQGLAARYVSGYLETQPQPGQPKLRGADASHAWVSVWLPGWGWWDIDPTNNTLVDSRYVVLGWGRDYQDVPPLRGVVFTDGTSSTLDVEVDLVKAGTAPFS